MISGALPHALSVNPSPRGAESRVHPTVRLDFLVRISTYPLFLILYLVHLYPRGITPWVWALIAAHMLVYPHAARFIATRSRDSKRAELRNLLVDSLLIGVYLPITGYSLWPNAAGIIGVHAGTLSVGGVKFALRGVLMFILGAVVTGVMTGASPDLLGASLLTQALSIAVVMAYTSVFSLHSHVQSHAVVRSVRQIREQNAQIEEKGELLEERSRQLEAAAAEAEAANVAKSNFLANMSHELRTPLNAIIGYSEMLIEEAEDADKVATLVPDLEKIRESGRHLLGLINDVLDLSKIEAGKMELYLEACAVDEILASVAATVRPLVEKNQSTLLVQGGSELGTFTTDLTRLRQVLLNLLSNAAKFTERGRITLTAERVRGSKPAGESIVFTVADSGIGMTPQQLAKLFRPFTQADASTTRRYGGTGLGLTITKHFVEIMGGQIEVKSEGGKGTTFVVRLPATVSGGARLANAMATRERPSPTPPASSLGTVLVIDDDPAACALVQRSLEREGFFVVCTLSGDEGIQLARELRPDAITLDVLMPGLDGWAVLSALKSDPELAGVPVVILSGAYEKPLAEALGAAAYLTKPLDRAALLSALRASTQVASPKQAEPILVVEDDPDARELVRRTLERQGYTVVEAADGRDAIEHLAGSTPSLIILDLLMPRMDGFAFLAALRANPEWRTLPVIVVSAKTLSDEERSHLQTASTVLRKGAHSADELLRAVGAATQKNR